MMTDGKSSDSNSNSSWIIPGAAILYIAAVWIIALWHFYYRFKFLKTAIQYELTSEYHYIIITTLWVLCVTIYFTINYVCSNKNYLSTTAFIFFISLFFTYIYYELSFEGQTPKQTEFIWGGLIISLWLSTFLSISYLLNKFNFWNKKIFESSESSEIENHFHSVNILIIIIIFFLSTTIYFFPRTKMNLDLVSKYDPKNELSSQGHRIVGQCREGTTTGYNNVGNLKLSQHTLIMIKEEHQKALQEIDRRTEIDDSWFHKKFVLVGGLFAAFLTYFNPFNPLIHEKSESEKRDNSESRTGENSKSGTEKSNIWNKLTTQIRHMFNTNVPSSILGMAFIVSLAIDIHIRHNQMVTQQLGIWIMNFVECLLSPGNTFIGWERFLRIDITDEYFIRGMHRDLFFSVLNAVHFYFTSIILYVLYISYLIIYASRWPVPPESGSRHTLWLIFWLVHFMLIIFVLQGNFFPSTLKVQLVLWPGMWFPGDRGGVIPFAIGVLVSYLVFMRVFTLLTENPQGHGENKEKSQNHEQKVQVQSDSTPMQNPPASSMEDGRRPRVG